MEADIVDTDESQEDAPKPKVKRIAEPKNETKEKVTAESKVLGSVKDDFVKTLRNSTTLFKKAIEAELDKVDVGHPHYSKLKFAKIRAERILFSLDELSRGSR